VKPLQQNRTSKDRISELEDEAEIKGKAITITQTTQDQ
jgi:hypothetical protein